jgi:tRNA G37 N-methylase TrmD
VPFVGAYVDDVDLPSAHRRRLGPRLLSAAVRFDVITLFPELFAPHLTQGVTRRRSSRAGRRAAVAAARLRRGQLPPRRRPALRRRPGMVMLVEPLERALQAIARRAATRRR